MNVHLELTMLSNLKAFYAERDIDISEIIQIIKNNKRGTFIGVDDEH
jgi:hypothetical protein